MNNSFYWITNGGAIVLSLAFFLGAWLLDRRGKQRFTTINLTLIATFCALSVVLTNVVGYSRIFGFQIMIGNFILFLTGMLFGPIAGVLIGVVTDGVGTLINLGGVYHAGFMLEKILFGFFGAGVFWFKTNRWWQAKLVFFLALVIICQLFVITPIALWSTGGTGYALVGLIKKVIIFPIELVLYPILTISCFRLVWLLLARLPQTNSTVWAARCGQLQFFLKPKKSMLKKYQNQTQSEVIVPTETKPELEESVIKKEV